MQFQHNQLPAAFAEEHGSESATLDEKPLLTNGDDSDDDEDLDMKNVGGRVWLVKVPKFLMEKWSAEQDEGAVLGRMRVYDEKDSKGDPKIAVILDEPIKDEKGNPTSNAVPTEYKLTLQNTATKNMYIFGEKEEDDLDSGDEGHRKRRRITSLAGTVHHECSLTPSLSPNSVSDAAYRKLLRERQKKASEPRRTMKMLDVDQGTANRMASGMGVKGYKDRVIQSNFVKTKQQASKSGETRTARLPKNELLDLLFTHFSTAPYWTLKALTEHVKQPQVYLKEVLSEIALLIPKGPYNGMWTLKKQFKDDNGQVKVGGKEESLEEGKGKQKEEGVKKEEGVEEDEEDDDDGDMVQVS